MRQLNDNFRNLYSANDIYLFQMITLREILFVKMVYILIKMILTGILVDIINSINNF